MALRKTPAADLKRKYPLYIQVGAVASLVLLLAFVNAPISTGGDVEVIEDTQEIIEVEDIEQTKIVEPPPPPPPAPPPPQEVPDDAVIEDEIIDDMEMDLDDFVPPPSGPPAPVAPPPPPPSNDPEPPPPPPEPEPEQEIFDVVEQEPELVGGIPALQELVEYPEMARRAGVEGTVYVQFVVDEQGRVTDAVCARTPNQMLCESSVEAVQKAEFRPGMQRGRPVKVRFTVPVRFKLN
ncbi:MAG: energy transducer TonB [Bacteroidota bacterium]